MTDGVLGSPLALNIVMDAVRVFLRGDGDRPMDYFAVLMTIRRFEIRARQDPSLRESQQRVMR